MQIRNGLWVGFLLLALGSCQSAEDPEQLRQEIITAEHEFAQLAAKEGLDNAFESFAAPDAVIYRDQMHPITGREAIRSLFTPAPPGTLSWEPTTVQVAASGDLGYSLGRYTYTTTESTGAQQQSEGYYITIWRRQADGAWKYVFDTGITAPAP